MRIAIQVDLVESIRLETDESELFHVTCGYKYSQGMNWGITAEEDIFSA